MGMNDKVLSHVRMLANAITAESNTKNPFAMAVEVRRIEVGARITVYMRPGGDVPSDPMTELGDLADAIRNEFRLERTKLGQPVYATSESTFTTEGDPRFQFEVWLV